MFPSNCISAPQTQFQCGKYNYQHKNVIYPLKLCIFAANFKRPSVIYVPSLMEWAARENEL